MPRIAQRLAFLEVLVEILADTAVQVRRFFKILGEVLLAYLRKAASALL